MSKPAKSLPPFERAVARLTGARLCFGTPVVSGERTVIPVASVRTVGGGGFGSGPREREGSGGGGGGALDARPVGFIEISPQGTRFERIDDGRALPAALVAASLAVLLGSRGLARRRRRGALQAPRSFAALRALRRGASSAPPRLAPGRPERPPPRARRRRSAQSSQRS